MNLQPALLQMNLYCTVLTAKTTLIPSVLHTILLVMLLRTVCVRPTGASRVSPPPSPGGAEVCLVRTSRSSSRNRRAWGIFSYFFFSPPTVDGYYFLQHHGAHELPHPVTVPLLFRSVFFCFFGFILHLED